MKLSVSKRATAGVVCSSKEDQSMDLLPTKSTVEDSSMRSRLSHSSMLDPSNTNAPTPSTQNETMGSSGSSGREVLPSALSAKRDPTTAVPQTNQDPSKSLQVAPMAIEPHPQEQQPFTTITSTPLKPDAIPDLTAPSPGQNSDRAQQFLHNIRSNQEQLLQYNPDDLDMNALNFTVIAEALPVVEQFLRLQQDFVRQGIPSTVDIGYHYTKRSYVAQIQSRGLLTLAERQQQGLPEITNGRTFGDGVYTSHNPFSYHGFAGGDVGLLVARLQGSKRRYENDEDESMSTTNTILGRAGDSDEVCVLQESFQCIPLVLFPTTLVEVNDDNSMGNYMVHTYHCSLQNIMDAFFHQTTVSIPWLVPSKVKQRQVAASHSNAVVFHYQAPKVLRSSSPSHWLRAVYGGEALDKCSICWNAMNASNAVSDTVAIEVCGHIFHEHCIRSCLDTMYSCPICRKCVGIPQGTSPSGTMTATLDPTIHCLGYAGHGTIVIQYDMPAGTQASYHENPGVAFEKTQRVAYIPNTQEGRDLLKRLKFAFCNGLTFRVGTSLTTGLPNRITWASIHHKTTVYCGAYGYPDTSYFGNVNAELDYLHVPKADDL